MKILIYIYIILYISYVVLGDHYIIRLIRNDKLDITNSINKLISRMFYLSYLALLSNAYFFYNPNINTWTICIILNIVAIIGFCIKFYNKRNISPYYYLGIVSHILIINNIIPLIMGYYYFNLNKNYITFKNIKFRNTILYLSIFLMIYIIIQNNIYIN